MTVVEAGTYKGDFALAAGNVMKQMERGGKVFTADTTDYGAEERFKEAGLEDYIEYYKGDFTTMLAEKPLWNVDFAFIE